MRTFIAVKIEPNKELTSLIHTCKSLFEPADVKWVEEHNLHVTLRFFGNTPQEIFPTIINELKKIAQNQESFDIELCEIETFGTPTAPKVIYAGVLPCPALINLSSAVEQLACSVGFNAQTNPFTHHLTLGRPKSSSSKASMQKLREKFRNKSFGKFTIDSIYFYQSVSTGKGPLYLPIEIIRLGLNASPSKNGN